MRQDVQFPFAKHFKLCTGTDSEIVYDLSLGLVRSTSSPRSASLVLRGNVRIERLEGIIAPTSYSLVAWHSAIRQRKSELSRAILGGPV